MPSLDFPALFFGDRAKPDANCVMIQLLGQLFGYPQAFQLAGIESGWHPDHWRQLGPAERGKLVQSVGTRLYSHTTAPATLSSASEAHPATSMIFFQRHPRIIDKTCHQAVRKQGLGSLRQGAGGACPPRTFHDGHAIRVISESCGQRVIGLTMDIWGFAFGAK